MTASGGAGAALCRALTSWGYVCLTEAHPATEKLTARGSSELSTERFQQLLAVLAVHGGVLHAFWMTEEPV